MKKIYIQLLLMLCISLNVYGQATEQNIEQRLRSYFSNYKNEQANIGRSQLKSFDIDYNRRKITIYANDTFGYQPFTESSVKSIYAQVKQLLPGPVNYFDLTIYADGKPIEHLIPNLYKKQAITDKIYDKKHYKSTVAWVENISRPIEIKQGLQNKHIALWQSHGRYFAQDRGTWKWQRPRLFGTTEDLLTQVFVVPYIIPMLENAGAVVYTPRERDWQRNEVIVDNDSHNNKGSYLEVSYKKYKWEKSLRAGFAQKRTVYTDQQNPFTEGTARTIRTIKKKEKAFAEWIPNIPEKGKYAVYISYQTLPESVPDAKYIVFHNGGATEFVVNQQMGGGTWVYLGTFEFDKGKNDYGMVILSNESKHKGVVSADAVRFGGGMGNIVRGNSTSGLPRFLEGARYNAQWSGFPYTIYSRSKGTNDYNDDINVRSLATNYLSGGSVFNPKEEGLKVPIELSLGVHTDAGYTGTDEHIGSLGIYTTNYANGLLGSGLSRYASRDFADIVLTNLQKDLSLKIGTQWARRSLWNRNYSETRLPQVPSMILELLAHQNFPDMKLAYHPKFQFTVGRSVYKSILKFLSTAHGEQYTVQPLPITHFAIEKGRKKHTFTLSWKGEKDVLEPTATPEGYIVYTRIGYGGFDNGTYVTGENYTFKAEPGLVYSFKVTAVNKGGESFPSEILSAYQAPKERGTLLIVNAFDKVSAPATIETTGEEGFDLLEDAGIPYMKTPVFCGIQQTFSVEGRGKETADGTGYSDATWEGRIIAGNTFDYPFIHGKAIQAIGGYSFVSASDEAIEENQVSLEKFLAIDLIFGADDKGFSANMQRQLRKYAQQGGNLLLSGAAIGTNMKDYNAQLLFLSEIFKYQATYDQVDKYSSEIYGANTRFSIQRTLNEDIYVPARTTSILPTEGAFSTYLYAGSNKGAGVAYSGPSSVFVVGFPIENITTEAGRVAVVRDAFSIFKLK